jgi:lipid-A-disaccharide synthase
LLGIAKSGTNTLEFSALSIPCVVYYKFGFLTNFMLSILRKKSDIKYASLVNIVADKEIIPEFTLVDCTENNIYNAVLELIMNEPKRLNQIKLAGEILRQLGHNDDDFSAKLITQEI